VALVLSHCMMQLPAGRCWVSTIIVGLPYIVQAFWKFSVTHVAIRCATDSLEAPIHLLIVSHSSTVTGIGTDINTGTGIDTGTDTCTGINTAICTRLGTGIGTVSHTITFIGTCTGTGTDTGTDHGIVVDTSRCTDTDTGTGPGTTLPLVLASTFALKMALAMMLALSLALVIALALAPATDGIEASQRGEGRNHEPSRGRHPILGDTAGLKVWVFLGIMTTDGGNNYI
jgi:hypothetical protein